MVLLLILWQNKIHKQYKWVDLCLPVTVVQCGWYWAKCNKYNQTGFVDKTAKHMAQQHGLIFVPQLPTTVKTYCALSSACHLTRAVAPPQLRESHVTLGCFIKARMRWFFLYVQELKEHEISHRGKINQRKKNISFFYRKCQMDRGNKSPYGQSHWILTRFSTFNLVRLVILSLKFMIVIMLHISNQLLTVFISVKV